ncbi:MAG TPA: LuxR C-terminal-related transcriptional regulator [Solirubrobacteraceae bacterium]|nr:LuxR C-terminal-related transcriptional regulator [Solirubrobacteraceae bacterium]
MSAQRSSARDPAPASAQNGWERFFWLVFNRSSIPMSLFDDRRVGVAFNQAACNYIGRPRAELVGRRIDADVAPQALHLFREAWQRLIEFGDWIGNVGLVRSDGTLLKPELAARATMIDGRRLVLSVMLSDEPWLADIDETHGELTAREQAVVRLLALGLTSPEIADRLSISVSTVRTHVRNAMLKTGTKTRAQLVAVALADRRIQDASE